MKQTFRFIAIATMFSALLYSCKKIEIPSPPAACSDSCRIESIYGDPDDGNPVFNLVGRFTYNDLGAPIFVEKQQPGTGTPDYSFRYDSMNRLTDFIEQYRNGDFEKWHRYKYDATNRITVDSVFVLGSIVNGQPKKSFSRGVTYLEYDAAGRVINEYTKDKKGNPNGGVSYSYNAQGNRTDGSTYDNKVNIHRLNKVWQFIDRDYSMNNAINVFSYQYNDRGLPTVINSNKAGLFFLDMFFYNAVRIEYTCR